MTTEIERLTRAETNIKEIRDQITLLVERVDDQDDAIEKLVTESYQIKQDVALIKQDIAHINESTRDIKQGVSRIDEKIDKITVERVDDHFMTPLKNYRNILWLIIAALVSFIIARLLPTV